MPGQRDELFRGYAEVAAKRPGAFTGSLSSRLPAGGHVPRAGPSSSEADQSDVVSQAVPRKVSSVSLNRFFFVSNDFFVYRDSQSSPGKLPILAR